MSKNTRILIVRLSAIGDVVHTLPLLSSLRKKYPDAFIGWAVEDRASDIIINNPLLDKVHVMPKAHWKKRGFSVQNVVEFIEYIKEIRRHKYDIAIDVQELLKSSVVAFLSGAKRRIAHGKTRECASWLINDKLPAHDNFDPNKPIIERYLEPAQHLGAPIDKVEFSLPPVEEGVKKHVDDLFRDIDNSKPVIVFSPATIWPSKHWKEDYWSILLDKLADTNNVIFCGAPSDLPLIERITSKAKTDNYSVFAGKTNIKQLTEVFYRTNILIAPDTGPTHIANATGIPDIICIFGSTAYKRSGPYGEQHCSLSANLACQPCFKRNCKREENQMECVAKITPDMVFNIINNKLSCK